MASSRTKKNVHGKESFLKPEKISRPKSSSPPSIPTLGPLREDIPQLRVVLVLIHMMHPDVSLQIVRSRVLMFSIRTERTDVAGGIVDEAVSDHFVFPLEAFAAF
jgi:hypothetical protein